MASDMLHVFMILVGKALWQRTFLMENYTKMRLQSISSIMWTTSVKT